MATKKPKIVVDVHAAMASEIIARSMRLIDVEHWMLREGHKGDPLGILADLESDNAVVRIGDRWHPSRDEDGGFCFVTKKAPTQTSAPSLPSAPEVEIELTVAENATTAMSLPPLKEEDTFMSSAEVLSAIKEQNELLRSLLKVSLENRDLTAKLVEVSKTPELPAALLQVNKELPKASELPDPTQFMVSAAPSAALIAPPTAVESHIYQSTVAAPQAPLPPQVARPMPPRAPPMAPKPPSAPVVSAFTPFPKPPMVDPTRKAPTRVVDVPAFGAAAAEDVNAVIIDDDLPEGYADIGVR